MGPEMVAYRQPDIITQRPYGFAIDDQGWLWEGQSSNILYGHNIHTAECKKVPLGVTRGSGACDIKFFGGMLIVAVQNGQDYVVHDLSTGKTHARPLPGKDPVFWYMQAYLTDG